MSKQNYYKEKKLRGEQAVDEELACELIREQRRLQPEYGTLKVYLDVKEEIEKAGAKIGRDKFFDIARKQGLLLPRKRKSGPRTTDSRHCFRVYGNKLKDLVLTSPNQAWVSDITYIRTAEGFIYLSLIMDAFSRKIIGFHAGDSLEVTGCLKALRMAIAQLPAGTASPIHHSDRGSQYCCHGYVALLKKHGIEISMTEENHCYENAKAERLNGILKQEYGLGEELRTKSEAAQAVQEAVVLYNKYRSHQSLNYRRPDEVHAVAA